MDEESCQQFALENGDQIQQYIFQEGPEVTPAQQKYWREYLSIFTGRS